LGHHISGICHELRGASPLLIAELVETLPPMRLALCAANLGVGGEAAPLEGGGGGGGGGGGRGGGGGGGGGRQRAAAPAVGMEVAEGVRVRRRESAG
jgi:hypothetical protein